MSSLTGGNDEQARSPGVPPLCRDEKVKQAGSTLAATWRTSNEVTLALLAAIPREALADRYSERTRTVAAQFAHIHYLRVRNLKQRGPAFLGELHDFPRGAQPGKGELQSALEASGSAIAELLKHCEATGSVKSWGGNPPATYLSYLVAHEAHHRALAIVSLRLSGHKLPQSALIGLWSSWGRKRGGASPAP
ncbi:MAG: DinB family protein [Planctomycetota bacterium]